MTIVSSNTFNAKSKLCARLTRSRRPKRFRDASN